MSAPSELFDIDSPESLFGLLKATFDNYRRIRGKRTQDLLFLLFGLTHLREWIAPGYDHALPPITAEELFYQRIFQLPEFKMIQSLCNRSKHMSASATLSASYGATIDDCPDIDSITDFDRGSPTDYFVNGQSVEPAIATILAFYEGEWFRQERGNVV